MELCKDRYSITELSEHLNLTDHALRYYEKEFNINIPKDDRGRRFYTSEQVGIMCQIKSMRDAGLEIKAIKKILPSENKIMEPVPSVPSSDENHSVSIVPAYSKQNVIDMKQFVNDLAEQITICVSTEIDSAKDHITKEICRSKLELGACVENSSRKLEYKLDKHFCEVDRMIGIWREKNKKRTFRRFLNILSK